MTKLSVRSLATLFALALAGGTASAQTTVTLNMTESQVTDCTIGSGTAASTVSNTDAVTARTSTDVNATRRALLKFDTENYVPKNATIQSAKLTVFLKSGTGAAARRIGAYEIVESFQETQANWKIRKTGTSWSTAGGSLGPKSGEAAVGTAAGAAVTIDVTKLVQARVNAGSSRYTRIALVDVDAADAASSRNFHSSEAVNPAVRPRLTVVYGGAPLAQPVPPAPVPPVTSTTLRLLHWNVHHGGVGTDGRYDPARIASWIKKFNPDVASLNEVDNQRQVDAIVTSLRTQTGVTWYTSFGGAGNLMISRLPLTSKSVCTYNASYPRVAGHVSTTVNGRAINIWSTHLAVDSAGTRLSEVKAMQACALKASEERIIAGDYNMQYGSTEYKAAVEGYTDAWLAAKALGATANYSGNCDGCTRNSRIDYVFTSKGATNLVLKSAEVMDTRDAYGKMPSDHKPMMVVYSVK